MDAVSRETPPPPSSAAGVFSDRLPLAERYADWLAGAGTVRGLLGPREVPRLWDRHLLNCAALTDLIPAGARVADVGSGAGLPGIVLALARPDLRVTLIEPLLRRTTFLDEVVAELGLDHVEVVRGRADDLHGRRTFDVVTSRAVAPLGRLLGWSMPLVAPTGALVAMKGRSVQDEILAAGELLDSWRCADPEVLDLGAGVVDPQTTVLRVSWADPSRIGWPLGRGPERDRRPQKRRRPRREAE